jgi:hypothetical protein
MGNTSNGTNTASPNGITFESPKHVVYTQNHPVDAKTADFYDVFEMNFVR